MPLISYCTHLSIKGPRRVRPARTEADIKCIHGGEERERRLTRRVRGKAQKEENTERVGMQDTHNVFRIEICVELFVFISLQLIKYGLRVNQK